MHLLAGRHAGPREPSSASGPAGAASSTREYSRSRPSCWPITECTRATSSGSCFRSRATGGDDGEGRRRTRDPAWRSAARSCSGTAGAPTSSSAWAVQERSRGRARPEVPGSSRDHGSARKRRCRPPPRCARGSWCQRWLTSQRVARSLSVPDLEPHPGLHRLRRPRGRSSCTSSVQLLGRRTARRAIGVRAGQLGGSRPGLARAVAGRR